MQVETKFITVGDAQMASDGRVYCQFDVGGSETWLLWHGPVTLGAVPVKVQRAGAAHFPLVPYRVKCNPTSIAALSAWLGAQAITLAGSKSVVRVIQAIGNPVITADKPDEALVYFGCALQVEGG